VLLLALLVFLLPLPLPLIVVGAGAALPVAERVRFPTAEQDPVSGELLLTTVSLDDATPARALAAWVDPQSSVLPRDQVIADDTPSEQYFAAQRELFRQTGQVAAAVGLRAAGLPVQVSGRGGARIVEVLPGAPAEGRLQVGDVIVEAAGAPVATVADLVALVSASPAGQPVRLTVTRFGRAVEVLVVPARYPGATQPGLGVRAQARDLQIDLPYPVQVDAGQIGGPSAGMMIALAVYDLADPQDLTRGRVVAGTGTIDPDGTVGPVGGVPLKVQAAIDAGAELFLAPPAEVAVARAAADDRIAVAQVATLQEAIQVLQAGEERSS